MRSLDDARRRGRECRKAVDQRPEESLFERLVGYIEEVHEFYPEAVTPEEIGTDKALLNAPSLWYDERLEDTPSDLLLQLAHELGHLEQHARVKEEPHRSRLVNPLASAPYLDYQDTVAVARYSTRSLEEAEATAFAVDFLCPSEQILEAWHHEPDTPLDDLASGFHVSVEVARVQLATALFDEISITGDDDQKADTTEHDENDAQERAVVWPEKEPFDERRPLVIDAGPGTGKTATLIRRAVYLIESGEASPSQILILTFSNEAAFELKDRLRTALGQERAQEVMVATFHGFGRHLLHYLGGRFASDVPGAVPVLDQASQEELVLDLIGQPGAARRFGPLLKMSDLDGTAAEAVRHINHLKQRLWTPERLRAAIAAGEVAEEDRPMFLALAELYEAYEEEKTVRGPVDFADLILLPIELLTAPEHTEAADTVRQQYPHVLVDEFQDVSEATGRLLYALCTETHPPWVVGDARQAIFRFLGAHPENVSGFLADYPNAKRIELDLNYRSCPEVVAVNNALAALMEDPELEQGSVRRRWRSAPKTPSAHGEDPVVVTVADSDTGERTGIADQVKRMIDEEDIAPDDIAVLARRNVDVRAIAVALGERGVEVSTVGLVTPEGAAGDLLAAASVRDAPDAAVVRLAAALGRDRYGVAATNMAVRHLLQGPSARDGDDLVGGDVGALAREVEAVLDRLQAMRGRPDAFGLITTFLFEASDYLRRILALPASAARVMALTEIASTLSEAGLYRFTHGDADAATARRGFISFFERKLRDGTPSRTAPGVSPGAVRIMTTHASKGLQFPHVVVAGQTMPPKQYWSSKQYKWIPTAARPTEDEDLGQADSLLFVGASRAQRSLIVSYAETATPSERARKRPLPPLLERWTSALAFSTSRWSSMEADAEVVEMGRVWGGTPQERMQASSFEKGACVIKAYLGEELRLDLPETDRPLYPVFFGSVRTVIGALVEGAHTEGRALTTQDARSVVAEHWPPESSIGHRHLPMFTELLNDAAAGFAEEYKPLAVGHRPVDLSGIGDTLGEPAPSLRFSAAFREDGGRLVLILFRPESLATELAKREPGKGNLNWSGGNLDAERTRVAIVRSVHPSALVLVYSAADRTLYEWNPPSPPRGKNLPAGERILGEVERTREMFASGRLEHAVSEFQCGRCRRRTLCPHWNELAET